MKSEIEVRNKQLHNDIQYQLGKHFQGIDAKHAELTLKRLTGSIGYQIHLIEEVAAARLSLRNKGVCIKNLPAFIVNKHKRLSQLN